MVALLARGCLTMLCQTASYYKAYAVLFLLSLGEFDEGEAGIDSGGINH